MKKKNEDLGAKIFAIFYLFWILVLFVGSFFVLVQAIVSRNWFLVFICAYLIIYYGWTVVVKLGQKLIVKVNQSFKNIKNKRKEKTKQKKEEVFGIEISRPTD